MSWFICGRVLFVKWHETSCSAAPSHVVMPIRGTLVGLGGMVTAGRVREVVDGLGGLIGCYRSNGYVLWFFFFSILVDGHCNIWDCQMISSRCTFIRKVSTSALWKRSHSLQQVCWPLPEQRYIFMWSSILVEGSILIRKWNYRRREILILQRASEDELRPSICGNTWLPNVSWSLSHPLPIWSEHWTQINCGALWLNFLEWCECWYGSKVECVCMYSSGIGSWLNHWPSLFCT